MWGRRSRGGLLVALTVGAALALGGCGLIARGAAGTNGAGANGYSDLSWDQQALQSIGFSIDDVAPGFAATDITAAPTPGPSAGPRAGRGNRLRHRLLHLAFGGRLEHGEAVVQTDEGTKTVVVQRGVVTSITSTSVTVKSADGFTITWAFGNPMTVVKDRAKVAPSSIAVGATVGVAGEQNGRTDTARLMVEPRS